MSRILEYLQKSAVCPYFRLTMVMARSNIVAIATAAAPRSAIISIAGRVKDGTVFIISSVTVFVLVTVDILVMGLYSVMYIVFVISYG